MNVSIFINLFHLGVSFVFNYLAASSSDVPSDGFPLTDRKTLSAASDHILNASRVIVSRLATSGEDPTCTGDTPLTTVLFPLPFPLVDMFFFMAAKAKTTHTHN